MALAFVSIALLAGPRPPLILAQEPPVSAQVDRTELSTGETLRLTVVVQGTGGARAPVLPPLDAFDIVGRSTASSITIINGKASGEVTYIYSLLPVEAGTLTIDSISVDIDGVTHTTEPIQLQVTLGAASPRAQSSGGPSAISPTELVGQDLFVEGVVDNPTPYLGEQVVYSFRYYRAGNTYGQPSYDAPEFTGFWSDQESEQRQYKTSAAGRIYTVIELSRVIFPTVSGPLEIGSGALQLRGDFFNRGKSLTSQPVKLDVRPLPAGAPANFRGGVGRYSISSELDGTSAEVNEPLTQTVTIEGTGNVNTLPDPIWPEMKGWRVFDSKASINSSVADEVLVGKKLYERLLVPAAPGTYTVPPVELTYFDPAIGEYRTVSTAPALVSVAAGARQSPVAAVPRGRADVERLASDIRHIKPVPTSLSSDNAPLIKRGYFWAAWAAPLLSLGVAAAWARQRRRRGEDTPRTRRSRAYRQAVAAATRSREEGTEPHVASATVLSDYLSAKLERPIAGLTRADLDRVLREHGVAPIEVDGVMNLLEETESAKYGPAASERRSGSALLERTESLIAELERELGR